jgi:hypothetical protein
MIGVANSLRTCHASGPRSVHQLVCRMAPATENEKWTWVSCGSLVPV